MMTRRRAVSLALTLAAAAGVAAAVAWTPVSPLAVGAAAPGPDRLPAPLELPSLAPPAVPAADSVRATVRPVPTAHERLLADLARLEHGIVWRRSRAVGSPSAGRLEDGVLLPREGVHFFTWDPTRWSATSPEPRRHGTDRLVRTILEVAAAYRSAHPDAPRLAVGDLSRPGGGSFDARFGGLGEFGRGGRAGHVSHQTGLDVDVYYPRLDRRERAPDALEDVDLRLAQALVDHFVAAGAQFVFVGPRTGLAGPPGVVQPLVRHDDHLHVRLPPG